MLSCACLCWTNVSLSAEKSQMGEGRVILLQLQLHPASFLPWLTSCLFSTMGMCLQIPCARLTPCCLYMPCIFNVILPYTEDALLTVCPLDGSYFSEAQSIFQHLCGLILRHLHHQFIPVQIILLEEPSKSKHCIKTYFFFCLFSWGLPSKTYIYSGKVFG